MSRVCQGVSGFDGSVTVYPDASELMEVGLGVSQCVRRVSMRQGATKNVSINQDKEK